MKLINPNHRDNIIITIEDKSYHTKNFLSTVYIYI